MRLPMKEKQAVAREYTKALPKGSQEGKDSPA
jgi:hypothetical protein